ncbi:hypothetical protein MSZK_27970 [Mycobacterium sp. shizuoka-1]|nr:hypothetical protein MSZK_27970 [Mycobacterium sp. shizuoka-1]
MVRIPLPIRGTTLTDSMAGCAAAGGGATGDGAATVGRSPPLPLPGLGLEGRPVSGMLTLPSAEVAGGRDTIEVGGGVNMTVLLGIEPPPLTSGGAWQAFSAAGIPTTAATAAMTVATTPVLLQF